ncbi:MAG: hypothetical protein HEQ13_01670 [Dolichospermum sp. DEX189]|nr:hypothetical protein [Dolichospermum sp. DEX189]
MAGQEARGKRQKARVKSKEVLGDFTFLYTVWFYCVHLLTAQVLGFFILVSNKFSICKS